MAIIFRAGMDIKDVETKLQSLPGKAQQAGRAAGQGLNQGLQQSNASNRAYVDRMQASMARAMAQEGPQADAARQRRRAREQAENARAQAALDAHNERMARRTEVAERRMDNARARTRAQERKKVEQEEKERSQFRDRVTGLMTGGVGFFLGHQLVQSATQYGDALNRIQVEMGGITAEQQKQIRNWQAMSGAAYTTQARAELRQTMTDNIQSEMERFRNESTDQGGIENIVDFVGGFFGRPTFQQQRNEAFSSRVGFMEIMARRNAQVARDRQSMAEQLKGLTPSQQASYGRNAVMDLLRQQQGLNLDDPKQLQRFQRLQAQIEGMRALTNPAIENMEAQRSAALQKLTPLSRQSEIRRQIVENTDRMNAASLSGDVTLRQELERRQTQLKIAEADADIDVANRRLDIGLMGAGGRRDAFRQLRREQREINRSRRLEEKGQKDARAFSGLLLDPTIGRDAMNQKAAVVLLGMIHSDLADLNRKLAAA